MPIPLDLHTLIKQCAPMVSPKTMYAIIKTESRGNPLAININGRTRLKSQPSTYKQAVGWVSYLETHEYNIDIGIAQVNIKNVHKFGFKAVDMLNPCINLKVAGIILQKNYVMAYANYPNKSMALLQAISAYNTGNYYLGFNNGYVSKVILNAQTFD